MTTQSERAPLGVHCWARFRRHRWHLLAVDPILAVTNLLYGCGRCRRVRTKQISGQWQPQHLEERRQW